MKKFWLAALLTLTCVFWVFGGCYAKKGLPIDVKGRRFYVEIAETDEDRRRGLMWRKKLDSDKGMLFIFPVEDIHCFWMKNTFIPLDIIWIDKEKKVVFISKNTQPNAMGRSPVIDPKVKATYVLEINGGISDEIGLKIGDKVDFNYPDKGK